MANNLFVSFDVRDADHQNAVIVSAIEELGEAMRLFSATWYVRSNLTASEAARRVGDVMESADALLIVDATGEQAAMFNVQEHAVRFMSLHWRADAEYAHSVRAVVEPVRQVEAVLAG